MKIKFYLLLVALVATIGSVWAQDFKAGDLWYRPLSGTTVAVIMPDTVAHGKYTQEHVTIPATVNGYDVVRIEESAFRDCLDLISVTVEGENLTTITNGAFFHCDNLKSLTLPKSLDFIGFNALEGCPALESITVAPGGKFGNYNNDGVLYNLTENRLVRYPPAKNITTYDIPSFVTILHRNAFTDSSLLETIEIPATVTEIEGIALLGNFKTITVAAGHGHFTEIDGVLFTKDETALVQFPLGKEIPGGVYNVPSSVTTLRSGAFWASSLKEIHFSTPNTITVLPNYTFSFS